MTRLYISWFDAMFDEVRYVHDFDQLRHRFVGQFPYPVIVTFSSAKVKW